MAIVLFEITFITLQGIVEKSVCKVRTIFRPWFYNGITRSKDHDDSAWMIEMFHSKSKRRLFEDRLKFVRIRKGQAKFGVHVINTTF